MKDEYSYIYHTKGNNPPTYRFGMSSSDDKDIVDFLKIQSKKIKTFRLAINILLLLFGKRDVSVMCTEIEKYGLINVLDKRLTELKKDSENYLEKT